MTKKIKILHLASFSGNIGDIANHEAFYKQFLPLFNNEVEIEKLEIRKFYKNWNEMKFDSKFVDYVNTFDLFIFGGGNFFELCWDYSETGTTFDISPELLKQIKTPIFINGVGIDEKKGISKNNIKKFNIFLSTLFKYNKVFFTIRNDGSINVVKQYFQDYVNRINIIPDHGFFIKDVDLIKDYKPKTSRNIGFNIAIDMENIRYKEISFQEFIKIMAENINKLLRLTDYNVFLFPHIESDYLPIINLLKHIDNNFVRTRISIAPLIQGQELESFKYYKKCNYIFAMRNHANICALSLGIPTAGLISYTKPGEIYKEIGLKERIIDINSVNFSSVISGEFEKIIINNIDFTELTNLYNETLNKIVKEKETLYFELEKWLTKNGLK